MGSKTSDSVRRGFRGASVATRLLLSVLFAFLLGTSVFAAPPNSSPLMQVRGWLVHSPKPEYLEKVVDAAAADHMNHLELSHDIIMEADEIVQNPERAQLIEKTAKRSAEKGMKAVIWSHEINTRDRDVDLDPNSAAGKIFWESRRNAYRNALKTCPSVAGVVLMFGSSPYEVWEKYNHTDGWSALSMPARVRFITDLVKSVVQGEFGKEVFVRDFNHSPAQLNWITEALRNYPGITMISKAEPQDFQFFYPHSASIGAFGTTPQIIEIDLCGEYWGHSTVPVSLAEYVPYRLKYDAAHGAIGAVGRIDLFENPILGTQSELNLYVYRETLRNPNVDSKDLYRDYLTQHYRLKPKSVALKTLTSIFQRTFPMAKKMYYTLGFWTWKNQSSLPESIAQIDRGIVGKSTAQWDPAQKPTESRLNRPDAATVRAILDEKAEAVALAEKNLADFSTIKADLPGSDSADLESRLLLTVDLARVYQSIAEAYWRTKLHRTDPTNPLADTAACDKAIAEAEKWADMLPNRWAAYPSVAQQGAPLHRFTLDLRSNGLKGEGK